MRGFGGGGREHWVCGGRSDQGPRFAGKKAPTYDPEWRLGQGSPGFLRKMGPTALDRSL